MPYRELTVDAPCALCEDEAATGECAACGRAACGRHLRTSGFCPPCDEYVYRELAVSPFGDVAPVFFGIPLLIAGAFLWAPLIAPALVWLVFAMPISRKIARKRRRTALLAYLRDAGGPPKAVEDPALERPRAMAEYAEKRRNAKELG